jgi:signal transduction histidine kinase/ligand-binding sensor domain-containing protein
MSKQKYLTICLLILLYFIASAQAQVHFDSWTTDDGLPQNSVRTMLQTSDGYLWLTTLDGLVRFDGIRFTVFNKTNSKNLPGNRFINLFAETADLLWICTEEQGVVRYLDGEFRTFTTADGLPSDSVFEVGKDSDGNLLAYTAKGAARFAGTRFIAIAPFSGEYGYKRFAAASGTFWELTENSLIAVKNGQRFIYDLPADLKKDFFPGYDFFLFVRFFEDRNGVLWLTTNHVSHNRLFKFTDGNFEEIKAEGMPTSLYNNLTQDRHGNLWFATIYDGACRLSQNRFVCYKAEKGLADNIWNIFTDREGTLWISTDNKGFFRLNEQAMTSLSTAQGLTRNNAYTIFEDQTGNVWIGSYLALASYRDGKFTNYNRSDGLIYSDVQSIHEDADGRLWIGALAGIQYLENGKFHDFKPQLDAKSGSLSIFDIHRDRRGILWFASNTGLFRYDGASAQLLTIADGLPGNNVKIILENDDGSFWIATYDGIALFKDEKFTNYTEKDGLAGNHVRALYRDETGTLWIGTYDSGLSRFKDGKFTNYTIESGLSSNGAFQILEDSRKNFWISSNQGIYRVSREQLNEFADGKRRVVTSTLFGKSDGMINTEANGGGQPAGIKSRDGRLWFPTQDGVVVINPEAVTTNLLPPPVVIENARIGSENIVNFQKGIEILSGQENLEIDYTGLSFIKPEQLRFRYRLENLDENWTEAGTRRTAFYPYLPPGEYTFRVIADNGEGVWNETGKSISIKVLPPFYRTWWFFALCGLLIGGIVFLIYQRRINQLEKANHAQEEFSRKLLASQEQERQRIASELHDTLGQSLLIIKNRVALAQTDVDERETVEEQLSELSHSATAAIEECREIAYNLRPYQISRFGLSKTLYGIFMRLNEVTPIRATAEIDDIDGILSPEAEINVYRIVQECVNNIIKHSAASEALLAVKRSDNEITLVIEDDGRGFLQSSVKTNGKGGFGLMGIAERVKMLHGIYEIESAPKSGTRIKIKI